jgi:flagella basal body P-ring formation protein FlgA
MFPGRSRDLWDAPIVGSDLPNMSRISRVFRPHFVAPPAEPFPTVRSVNKPSDFALACTAIALLWLVGALAPAVADDGRRLDGALAQQVRELTLAASKAAVPGTRVEVEVGELDARLRLSPCQHVQPYLPDGVRLWGKARIGLRCLEGATRWNVYLPVTVRVFAASLVAAQPLPSGTVLTAADLHEAEVDLAADRAPVVSRSELAVGRVLARPLATGEALRSTSLRIRQWFGAGDTVRIVAQGEGYAVTGEGVALAPGNEGQAVRVRTEAGRIVSGMPAGDRRIEVAL